MINGYEKVMLKVSPASRKDTLVRRLALEEVRKLRRAGLSYRGIGRRFDPRRGGKRTSPPVVRPGESSAPPPPSAGPVTSIDHRLFLRALDAVRFGLLFFDRAGRAVHANEPAIDMLSTEADGD